MEWSEEEARVSDEGIARNEFSGGDFVWGKIKNHPWWPGQVHDTSHASQLAKSVRRREEQSLLVAYFGDRTFAWCEPSQLRHFGEGFDRMARQSMSKSFVGALKEALDSIQFSVESEILLEQVDRTVVNAGIEEGTAAPAGRVKGLRIGHSLPAEMLERLREIACDVSGTELLEVAGIRAWFSALSRWMGWRLELEDEKIHGNGGFRESVGEVEPATPVSGRSSHRKRMRSLADLIAQTKELISRDEEIVCVKKLDSTGRQQRKKNQARSSDSENVDVEREEGAVSGRRERKRSRYLSPPYITTNARAHHSFSHKDREVDHLKEDHEIMALSPRPMFVGCSGVIAFKGEGDASAEDMLHELCRVALDFTNLNGDLSSSRVRTFFDKFRGYSYAPSAYNGESGVEDLRFVKDDVRSNIYHEGESQPIAHPETPDHSRASSSWKYSPERKNELMRCDTGDGGVFRSEEKSTSGSGKVEIQHERISQADDGRSNFNLEGESEPTAEFETSDRSPASSGCKSSPKRGNELISCDTDEGGLSRSEEKSISIAQGNSESEKFEIQPKRNSADDEAAIQLTLGSGPARSISGQKHPLEFIKKSLEAMISALRSSFPPDKDVDSSESLDPEARENLICEMNRLLKNVDELLAGSSTSVSS